MRRSSIVLVAAITATFGSLNDAQARTPRQRAPRIAEAPAPAAPEAAPAPAEKPPVDGVWSYVAGLEGAPPSVEAVEGTREQGEEKIDQADLIDRLGSVTIPTGFYTDPRGALKVDPLHLDQINPAEFDIPIDVNAEVISWMRYFTGTGRKHYHRYLERSTRYRPLMYRELEKRGLPRDLVYLSMIESGYNAHAYSSADAAGLWQFIPSTGRLYKLRIDYWVDDRRDPELSTDAGLTFLADLHHLLGDWRLAWAAYNGGPGRVQRATARAGTKDFWTLARGEYLHPETDNYVPKIMAAAIIGHHPEWYGFTDVKYQPELAYETAKVEGQVEFAALAKAADTDVATITDLNPALRHGATPPEGYNLRVPVGARETFLAKVATLPRVEAVAVTVHKVKRGETLGQIATKYGTTAGAIAKANRLRNIDVITVGMNLQIPGGRTTRVVNAPTAAPAASEPLPVLRAEMPIPRMTTSPAPTVARAAPVARAAAPPAAAAPKPVVTSHTVRSGDTLSTIASRYDVSIGQLRAWNGLSNDTILVGQRLKVHGTTTGTAGTRVAAAPAPTGTKTSHTVRSGESLTSIAAKYHVAVADVQRWNGIKNASHVEAGQKLVVYAPASQWTRHTIRSGESLGSIATKYGCTVSELKSWNGLSGSVIHPGDSLKIKKD